MKKIKFSIIALFVAAVTFTSCDDDTTLVPYPVITFTEGTTSILTGEAVSVSGTVYAEGELDQVVIKKDVDGTITELENVSKFDNDTIYPFALDFIDETESFTIIVEATDKEGQIKSGTAIITVTVPETVVTTTDLKIFCALSDQNAGEIYASLTPEFGTYTFLNANGDADITAMIDIMYYNGDYTKAGEDPRLVSPHAAPSAVNSGTPLTNAKTTYLKVLTDVDEIALFSDWTSITDDTEITSITGIVDTNTMTLAVDDIVVFELADGKKGVFKVNSWTPGWGLTDHILIDVIVQINAPVK